MSWECPEWTGLRQEKDIGMDKEDTDFARIWARRYIREHHPHGLGASDVENMILRRLHTHSVAKSDTQTIKHTNNQIWYNARHEEERKTRADIRRRNRGRIGRALALRSDATNDTFLPATRHMPGISHFRLLAS